MGYKNREDYIAYHKRYREENKERRKAARKLYYQKNREKILVAKKAVSAGNYKKRKEYYAEYKKKHKEKYDQYFNRYYKENTSDILKRKKESWYTNIELSRKMKRLDYAKNRAKCLERRKKYCLNNPHKITASNSLRRAKTKQRTPKWLGPEEMWLIEQAYELATLRTKMFGFAWHVDHVIPMRGKYVSGLHVPINLQVIPGVENIRKKNKYMVM